MNKSKKPYAILCFECPHCNGIIEAELYKARLMKKKESD